jgi:hypothetical protein
MNQAEVSDGGAPPIEIASVCSFDRRGSPVGIRDRLSRHLWPVMICTADPTGRWAHAGLHFDVQDAYGRKAVGLVRSDQEVATNRPATGADDETERGLWPQ